MNHSLKTRALSFLLAAVMVFGMFPMPAMATETEETTAPAETTVPVVSEEPVVLTLDDGEDETVYVTVTFDAQNGTDPVEQSVESGTAAAKPEDPAYEGYTFAGWYFGEEAWDFEAAVTEAVTLTAKWEEVTAPVATTYPVTFKADNGTEDAVVEVEAGSPVAAPEAPVREGYTFLGWYCGDNQWDFATPITGEQTLIAGWEEAVPEESSEPEDVIPEESTESEDVIPEESTEAEDVIPEESTESETTEEEQDNQSTGVITGWSWIDEYEVIDPETNTFTIISANADNYVSFSTVEEVLPVSIAAVVDGNETVVELAGWSCDEYPAEGTYYGNWFFQAALPEGSSLAEGVPALEVKVYFDESAGTYESTGTAGGIEYTINSSASTDGYYKLISKRDWTLAPGIHEAEIVLNNSDGSYRQVLFVMEADLSNEYVNVINSYTGMIPEYGNYKTGVMSQQVATAEELGYVNVVGAMNTCLSWYTGYPADRVGEPLGFIMLDAEVLFDPANCGYEYGKVGFPSVLVINKDYDENGNPRPADIPKVEMPQITSAANLDGWEDQVIPCSSGYILKDGVNQYTAAHTDPAPRSVVGIKPDGKVVIMVNDGRQEPYSAGMCMYELAEVMLDLGCTYAVNCDGGGSTTWVSQRPGEDIKVNNSPSDGTERPTTTGILFVSTAPATGEFARADISSPGEYFVPGCKVEFDFFGTDLVGTVAEIPADVTWQIAEENMGTVENGVFVSNGTVGTVTVQMVYNDKVVGQDTINVVIPEEIKFGQSIMTIPYDKEVSLSPIATINGGLNEVVLAPEDVTFSFTNEELGTLEGFMFTSVSETVENNKGTVTVTLKCKPELSATAQMALGKGSEVLFDFESEEDLDAWNIADVNGNDAGFVQEMSIASSEDGQVHDGEGSLRLLMNPVAAPGISNGGYGQSDLYLDDPVIVENAKSIGFWAYIPDEYEHCWIRVMYWYDPDGDGKFDKKNTISVINQPDVYNNMSESGWKYFSVDVSAYSKIMIAGVSGKDQIAYNASKNDANNFRFIEFMFPHTNTNDLWKTYGTINGPQTVYIDNITADFSDAVDDREAPIFGTVTLATLESTVDLENNSIATTTSNSLNVIANVSEDTKKTNATGLNADSAAAYVDGIEVPCTFSNGRMSIGDVVVADGVHRVKFEIADNMGNKSVVVRLIKVNSGVDASTVQLVPKDAALDSLYGGSVYWMDLKATDVETIQSVSMRVDLNGLNHWELAHTEYAPGFTGSYSIDEENNAANITITRTGTNTQTGEAVIASLPIRVVSFDTDIHVEGYNAETYWTTYGFWPYDLKVDVDMGKITYVEGYTATVLNGFSNEEFSVDTELQTAFSDASFKAARGTAHVHTATAVEDKAATCIEAGYTNRTYCEVCSSVVAWGNAVSATGVHNYELVDGKLTCVPCGKLLNGVHTDGKTYVDGVVVADGWSGESYYVNGQMITGVYQIEGKYYNFGENGICPNGYPMSAEWWTNEKGESFYFNAGVPLTEYSMINSVPTYFDEQGVAWQGEKVIDGQTCVYEKGAFVESTTAEVLVAGRAGTDAYFILYADGTFKILGEGATYDFVSVGNTYLPKLSWKNRPWGKNTELSNGIKKVYVGKDITCVGSYFFNQCYNIEEIVFEEGSILNTLKNHAFHYSSKLRSVVLPDTLSTLGYSALGYCASLVDVTMPESAEKIDSRTFWNNNSKLILNVVEGSAAETFAKSYGIAYVTRKPLYGPTDPRPTDKVVASGTCGSSVTWTLYEGGKLILAGSGAMDDYTSHKDTPWAAYRSQVKAVKIGKDITKIGQNAFAHMYNLAHIVFEEGSAATSLGNHAFHYASKVQEVILPDSIKSIGWSALGYCASLVKVQMPEFAATIDGNAFWNDSSKLVLNVVAGSAAESFAQKKGIGYETRESSYKPGDIIPGDAVIASGDCGENATWTLYEGGKLVVSGSGAIDSYTSHKNTPWADYRTQIKSVKIGKDITAVGNNAFAHMYSLANIVFEDGSRLNALGDHAFHYASKVKEVVLPDGIKTMGWSALGYCASLVKVQMPEYAATINSNAFWNHNTGLVLNVVENSAAEAFAQKQSISYETRESSYGPADPIPSEAIVASGSCGLKATWCLYESGKLVISGSGHMDNYTSHKNTPWYAYKDQVKSVKIGKEILVVGDNAFAHMYNLASIVFEEGSKVTTLGNHAFHYASKTKEIILPDSVETIGYSALGYGASLKKVQMPVDAVSISPWAFWNARTDLTLSVVENSKAHAFAVANEINFTLR